MCTVITSRQKPKIAKKDIPVYKDVLKVTKHHCMSLFQGFNYIANVLYATEMTIVEDAGTADNVEAVYSISLFEPRYVQHGFHAFASIKRMRKRGVQFDTVEAEFIIPKGSLYYLNGANNIVSNQIIFKDYI